MARKMDKYAKQRDEIRALDKKLADYNKAIRELKASRESIEAVIMKGMQNSVEGTVDGQVAFRIKTSERKTATIARVREFAPEVQDQIIQKVTSKKIEVL